MVKVMLAYLWLITICLKYTQGNIPGKILRVNDGIIICITCIIMYMFMSLNG